MKKIVWGILFFLVCLAASSKIVSAGSHSPLEGTLSVVPSKNNNFLQVIYSVKNLTNSMVGPNPESQFRYTIRNIETGEEVAHGELDGAFDVNVSQYASPGAHAVWAVKKIPITKKMKDNPGFYLMFLLADTLVSPEEVAFYITND